MNILQIHLKDFRRHSDLTIDLAPVTILVGPNGSGKSTVQGALEFLVSGKCAWTDENGRNGGLARNGTQAGSVSLVAPNGDRATRTTDGVLSCSWRPNSKQNDAQHELEAGLGCTGDRARLCLRAGRFFGLDTKAQKALLSELLNLDIQPEDVKEELKRLDDGSLLTTAVALVSERLLADFGRGYKAAYEERTVVNRLIKHEKQALENYAKEEESLVCVSTDRLIELEAIESGLARELADLNRREGEARGRASAFASLEAERSRAEAAVAMAEQATANAPDDGMTRADLVTKQTAAKERLAGLEAELAALRTRKSACATCGQATLDDSDKTKGAELSTRIERGRQVVQGLAALSNRMDWREQAQATLEAKRAHLKQVQDSLGRAAVPAADFSADRQAIRAKAEEVREDLLAARRWRDHVTAKSETKRKLEAAEKQTKTLTELCGFFSPDGYQAKVLAVNLEPFLKCLEGVLSHFGLDMSFGADLAPITSIDNAPVSFARLSDGEQIIVALAYQVAFAKMTGLKIVVIDRVEALDEARQRELVRACQMLIGEVDHFLLLGVRCEAVAPDGVQPEEVEVVQLGREVALV